MITYGRSIRWFNNLTDEINFSIQNNFNFIQIWFKDGKLLIDNIPEPIEENFSNTHFPIIIHVVYDIFDYDKYNSELLRILKYLKHTEVIIHPICEAIPITSKTITILAENIYKTNQLLKKHNIKLYVENNSIIDPINYSISDLKIFFDKNQDVELLLDLAHIDDYAHLKNIINIKFPTCLHIADKHFSVDHEHLPIGQGDLDFNLIFKNYLKDFDGKIIFEVIGSDEEIIHSKNIISSILENK